MLPITWQQQKTTKQMQQLQPELKQLKAKHGHDKQALQKAQMELYQKYNMNPLAGCLPFIAQIAIFLVLYQLLVKLIGQTEIGGVQIDPVFLGINLAHPDPTFILPILSGVTQLILSMMILPATETPNIIPDKSSKKVLQEANKKEEDVADMAATMQKQMVFLMPAMTVYIAWKFPSGLALYWVVTTVFSILQQWVMTGPGGLKTYTQRAYTWISTKGGNS
jgi:YidC/Oxa1 family membrane protein insertase